MWRRLENYLSLLKSIDFNRLSEEERKTIQKQLLIEISFFQHERIVHLIVTVCFALLSMLGIIAINLCVSIAALILELLFVCLLIPYVVHYYRLENGVQELYKINDKINNNQKN